MNSIMRQIKGTIRLAAVGAILLASLWLAACGGDNGTANGGGISAGGGTDQAKFEQAALKHAECMRKNGVDVPDPKPGQGGIVLNGRAGGDPAAFERAEKECARYLKDLPPPKLSEKQKSELRDAALAHARCMRKQGIDFPDPTFDRNGAALVRIGEDLDPDSSRVRGADAKCRTKAPDPIGARPTP